jgi:hypothetical protein
MLESLASPAGVWIAIGIALVALAGFAVGRFGGAAARRARSLTHELADSRAAEERTRAEHEAYRKRVADHFTETSERLHELTLQYRSVYEHLAKGANELCPEGFSKLEGGLGLDALPEESAARPSEASETAPAQSAEPEPPTA